MKENVRQTKESPHNQLYTYITRDDLLRIFDKDDVVLTIKNYETMSMDSHSADDDTKHSPRNVRFCGNWKSIDARLVTNNGKAKGDKKTALHDMAGKLTNNTKRGPGRLKRGKQRTETKPSIEEEQQPSETKSNDDDDDMDCDDADRQATAKALLHFAPNDDFNKSNANNRFGKLHEGM